MGKKLAVNEKAAEARAKKADAKGSAAAAKAKAAEDAAWAAHANPRGKKDAKREEEEARRAEAAKKKAEAKRLAAEEEAAMANLGKKPAPKKVTHHQLRLQSEADRRAAAVAAAARTGELKREVSADDYAAALDVANANREEAAVAARSLDEAVRQLTVAAAEEDRHPEKRAKAAWEAFYARELPIMKEDKPGLKLMQYKSRIFEMWQRSPENPRNQVKE